MADAPTLSRPPSADDQAGGRTIRPRRSLPGGRAVIGAFLVIVAAVGTFGAYLQATAAPETAYMVATRTFQIGHVIEQSDLVGNGAGFRAVPIDLPEAQAQRAVTGAAADAELLLGTVVVAPIAAGDLIQRTQFVSVEDAGDGVSMSFSLPADRALAGRLGPGERIDIIATFPALGTSGSETRLVARDVIVIAASDGGEGLSGGRVTLTVELPDLALAQQVQHAVDTAQVAILRGGDPGEDAPPATRSGAPPAQDAPAEQADDGTSTSQEEG